MATLINPNYTLVESQCFFFLCTRVFLNTGLGKRRGLASFVFTPVKFIFLSHIICPWGWSGAGVEEGKKRGKTDEKMAI